MGKIKKAMYRVVIIGCGKVGALYETEKKRSKPASHAGYIIANPHTKLAALVDTSPTALTKAGKLFPQARKYTSAHRCLKKEHPDIVVIATPPRTRLILVRLCIQQGVKAIICEKPLASTIAEAKTILRIVKKNGITFMVNYQRRFAPLFARVRRDIVSGALGKIQQVTCYYSNGLYNNGGHAIDALLYLLGEDMAVRWARVNRNAMHVVGDPCIDAVLETKKGTRIHLQSVDQKSYGIFDIRVLGTCGERVFTNYSSTLIETSARTSAFKEIRQLDRARARVSQGREGNVLAGALRILARGERQNNAAQALTIMRILDSIQHAAKKK